MRLVVKSCIRCTTGTFKVDKAAGRSQRRLCNGCRNKSRTVASRNAWKTRKKLARARGPSPEGAISA